MRACCALRSKNGIGWATLFSRQAHAPGGAKGVVLKFRDHAAQQRQRGADLPGPASSGDLINSAANNGRVGGAGGRHQQAGVPGRHRYQQNGAGRPFSTSSPSGDDTVQVRVRDEVLVLRVPVDVGRDVRAERDDREALAARVVERWALRLGLLK